MQTDEQRKPSCHREDVRNLRNVQTEPEEERRLPTRETLTQTQRGGMRGARRR